MDRGGSAARFASPRSPSRARKRERQRLVRDLVGSQPIASQQDLVDKLAERGVRVTQATVSRDIAQLGLVKVAHAGGPVYAWPGDLSPAPSAASDERLRRVLSDYPIRIGRSGLTLLLLSEAGVANAIGQAIDESTFNEQEGTLAGDNTLLVLFADEARLERWLERFDTLRTAVPKREHGR
ncbi:MAG TPA: arginine repressor [Anaerolineae bacterium]|nr:arginine repressor [Anaerolineae bacterium]